MLSALESKAFPKTILQGHCVRYWSRHAVTCTGDTASRPLDADSFASVGHNQHNLNLVIVETVHVTCGFRSRGRPDCSVLPWTRLSKGGLPYQQQSTPTNHAAGVACVKAANRGVFVLKCTDSILVTSDHTSILCCRPAAAALDC
jgi:hypothetical protein